MLRSTTVNLCLLAVFLMPSLAQNTKVQKLSLTPASLEAINTRVEPVNYRGKKAIRLLPLAGKEQSDEAMLAVLTGSNFTDGSIELEVSGAPRADAKPNMRGFIGLAFRVQGPGEKFECFYLRPSNGRANDQLMRNHSLQYLSAPDYGWQRLRNETPGVYESYADLIPGEWTKMKIVVSGATAQLYVNGAPQPALVVNDLKLGNSSGAIALWSHTSTDGYFANLTVK